MTWYCSTKIAGWRVNTLAVHWGICVEHRPLPIALVRGCSRAFAIIENSIAVVLRVFPTSPVNYFRLPYGCELNSHPFHQGSVAPGCALSLVREQLSRSRLLQ